MYFSNKPNHNASTNVTRLCTKFVLWSHTNVTNVSIISNLEIGYDWENIANVYLEYA